LRLVNGAPPIEHWREPLVAILRSLVLARTEEAEARPYRFLALTDWTDASEWRSVLDAFSRCFSSQDSVTLRLIVDLPVELSRGEVIRSVEARLAEIAGSAEQLPDIELDFSPPAPDDLWNLFRWADAAIGGISFPYAHLARAASIPVVSPDQLASGSAQISRAA
jgi:hypothetical protein